VLARGMPGALQMLATDRPAAISAQIRSASSRL